MGVVVVVSSCGKKKVTEHIPAPNEYAKSTITVKDNTRMIVFSLIFLISGFLPYIGFRNIVTVLREKKTEYYGENSKYFIKRSALILVCSCYPW